MKSSKHIVIYSWNLKDSKWTLPWVDGSLYLPIKSFSFLFIISLKHISEFIKIEILQFICLLKSLLFDIICLWCTEWNFFRDTVFWLDFWIVDITTSSIWSVDDPNIAKLWTPMGHFSWISLNQISRYFRWIKILSCVTELHLVIYQLWISRQIQFGGATELLLVFKFMIFLMKYQNEPNKMIF